MPRNIEIKARLTEDIEAVLPRAEALSGAPAQVLQQDDSFFQVPHGRLKLRAFADGSAELIHYHRADTQAAKASDYVRTPVADADGLREALVRACGSAGRVQKTRWLCLVGATRVHLDRVAGLGDCMELEVVLDGAQSDADGTAIAEDLMQQLGLGAAPRIAAAYVDLLDDSVDGTVADALVARTPCNHGASPS